MRALSAVRLLALYCGTTLLLASTGCGLSGNSGIRGAQKLIQATDSLLATFRSVTDAESGRAAIDDVDSCYRQMASAQEAIIAHELKHGQTRGLQTTIDQIERDMKRIEREMNREVERLMKIKDLPAEFWAPAREHSSKILFMSLEYQAKQSPGSIDRSVINATKQACDLYEKFTPLKVVEFELKGAGSSELSEKVETRLRENLPSGAKLYSWSIPGESLYMVAPATVDEVIRAADFATVEERHDGRRELILVAQPKLIEPGRWAPGPGQEPAPQWSESTRQAWRDAIEKYGNDQVATFYFTNTDEIRSQGLNPTRATTGMTRLVPGARSQQFENNAGWLAPVADFDAFCSRIRFGKVVSKDEATLTVKIELAASDKLSDTFTSPSRTASRSSTRRTTGRYSGLLDKNAPDYHKKLAERMMRDSGQAGDSFAIRALLEIHPSDITDSAVRKTIARNFRTMALKSTFSKDLAIQGLVHYAGKHSVPTLIQIIDGERMRVPDEVYDALGKLKDPRGAEAVARKLGDFFNHRKAVASLRQMGSVAEEVLKEKARSNEEKISLASVEILGDVGTEASYDLLRQASKSRNPRVKEAAREALRKIRAREKASS